MRIILFTGKGGVGKSTIAAATAVRTAMLGRRTLLVSSDMAHNLSDITEVPIGHAGALVAENLHALEVDILAEIRENWAPIQEYMADIAAFVGLDGAVAEEVAMIPGMDAVFVLTRILREVESDRFDTKSRRALKKELSEKLGRILDKEVLPRFRIDPRIIGGVVIRVGDSFMDGSIRHRLHRLRRSMLKADIG